MRRCLFIRRDVTESARVTIVTTPEGDGENFIQVFYAESSLSEHLNSCASLLPSRICICRRSPGQEEGELMKL